MIASVAKAVRLRSRRLFQRLFLSRAAQDVIENLKAHPERWRVTDYGAYLRNRTDDLSIVILDGCMQGDVHKVKPFHVLVLRGYERRAIFAAASEMMFVCAISTLRSLFGQQLPTPN